MQVQSMGSSAWRQVVTIAASFGDSISAILSRRFYLAGGRDQQAQKRCVIRRVWLLGEMDGGDGNRRGERYNASNHQWTHNQICLRREGVRVRSPLGPQAMPRRRERVSSTRLSPTLLEFHEMQSFEMRVMHDERRIVGPNISANRIVIPYKAILALGVSLPLHLLTICLGSFNSWCPWLCLLPAVCCLTPAACCLLSMVCCLLSAVCYGAPVGGAGAGRHPL
jgi:hypothetical protein